MMHKWKCKTGRHISKVGPIRLADKMTYRHASQHAGSTKLSQSSVAVLHKAMHVVGWTFCLT